MPDDLKSVCVRAHNCHDPVEKLYYSCGFPEVICIYCSKTLHSDGNSNGDEPGVNYPQCTDLLS